MARKPKVLTEEELCAQIQAAQEKRAAADKRAAAARNEEAKLQQRLQDLRQQQHVKLLLALDEALLDAGIQIQSQADIRALVARLALPRMGTVYFNKSSPGDLTRVVQVFQ